MKKRFLALTLVALLLLPVAAMATEIDPAFPALYTSIGMTADYAAPCSRAAFSMLTFQVFSTLNSNTVPQMDAQNAFTDVGESPEDVFVLLLYGMRIVSGVSENSFMPRRTVTREEACTMLARAALCQDPTLMVEMEKASIEGISDADAVSVWAKQGVSYLYAKGVLPLKDGKLAPADPLTTEEAMLLCSAFIAA